ncbi:hypothetical protein Tc00.1047053506835.50 [Trypanosoma cruzi]|uniref:Uncharacterized protein n=2 Tax=Trypanosoma cruzi TaxID=5693 RepID=Q4DGQ0_TRYCC|nr:hypothetical protein Tc00.1047053506835.50 [Trypanosoma cruzi]EAN91695.1 hypothetical protein Tc00.1047053506835.50 [Trypanosoma cruzi]|eukprot:XP_813546.1 hypothetical protein [Trypanosoma cruzi strain CL Brener]
MTGKQKMCPTKSGTAKDNMWIQRTEALSQRSQSFTSREQHRKEVRLRAQRILEENCRSMEERQREKEELANRVRLAAMQRRLTDIQRLNRATEKRVQHAKMLQESQMQARGEKLQAGLQKLDEASYRREKTLTFYRLRTAQQVLSTSERAKVNRSLIEREVRARQHLHEEREEARQRAAEEEKINREIELQQRGLLRDQRVLNSIEYQRQRDHLIREKGLQRERAHEERLQQHKLQKGRWGFGKAWCGADGVEVPSSAWQSSGKNASASGNDEKTTCAYRRAVTSLGIISC